jgi:hypothetical protein
MRNLLDKSSAAQSLDGSRLTGSLLVPDSTRLNHSDFRIQGHPKALVSGSESGLDGRTIPSELPPDVPAFGIAIVRAAPRQERQSSPGNPSDSQRLQIEVRKFRDSIRAA